VALNMIDVAERRGVPVDPAALEEALQVPVVDVVARDRRNVDALRAAIDRARTPGRLWRMPGAGETALERVRDALRRAGGFDEGALDGQALRLMAYADESDPALGGEPLRGAVADARRRLEDAGIDRSALEPECRYALCNDFARRARKPAPGRRGPSFSETIDRLVTHRLLGPLIYLVVMGTIFQAVYAWGEPLMHSIEDGTVWLGGSAAALLGPGMLTDLLVDGVLAGVGNVIIFLPQICLLFLLLTLLEDVGYLARAAFLVDRIMRGVGLHGRAFIPLMTSFACAVPGILATRTIENRRDRLVTILVAPLMSCSARLPVYALLIGTFVAPRHQGVTLLSMYALSVLAALGVARLLRGTLFRGKPSTFILELPTYKLPALRHVLRTVLNRAWVFVRQAGTIILACSIVLWALAYFPRSDEVADEARRRVEAGQPRAEVDAWADAAQIEQSIAGGIGRAIEPAIEPLGFDWKIGIGLVSSFAAREVMVSSLGIVYAVGPVGETSTALRHRLRGAVRADGSPSFTGLTAISLMVFFVLACQCMSTLAVVRRETNSWHWPLFMFGYMTALAYVSSLAVYQGGLALGFGA
jgi:ferrous iron transport protein B